MKKILLALAVSVIYLFTAYGQDTAAVSIPFQMYDNGGGQRTLYFGLDSTATDSIDSWLGESDLPPFPPAGVFEARWILPQNNFDGSLSSYRDYRNSPSFPYTDSVEYRLKYQGSESADTMFFAWNFPPQVSALLQDLVTGNIVHVQLSGSGVFGLTNFSVLNQMRLEVYYMAILPVELTSFKASVLKDKVVLTWQTESEKNNYGFEVERLKDSKIKKLKDWKQVGFVQGMGTTTKQHSYTFYDDDVSAGTYSYRLKQIDLNGSYKYSKSVEVLVTVPGKFSLEQNYPNPFNPTTTIRFSLSSDSKVSLAVFNIIGQQVEELINGNLTAGNHEVKFDGTNLSSGVYFYKLEAKGIEGQEYNSIRKMILLR